MTCHVLVVEDEALLAMMVQDLLVENGCEPVMAANGRQAFALISQAQIFDLAVIDLNIPEGDGATVIRALWNRWPVPVIVSTGYQDLSHEMREALSPFAAPLEVISKPWSEAVFLDLVRRLLRQAQGRPT
ncbi:response regulator [Falsiroseomonas sp. HC035]|uniref:response regulator n=1 Tax=Falsiroseomonas sp. HC035 TaxID=3390999 RepID=UPI003D31455C